MNLFVKRKICFRSVNNLCKLQSPRHSLQPSFEINRLRLFLVTIIIIFKLQIFLLKIKLFFFLIFLCFSPMKFYHKNEKELLHFEENPNIYGKDGNFPHNNEIMKSTKLSEEYFVDCPNHPTRGRLEYIESRCNMNIHFREMANINEMSEFQLDSILADELPFPGGVEDELATRMSSLGRVPEDEEYSKEVGGDRSGDLGVLGLNCTKGVSMCEVGDVIGSVGSKGGSGEEQIHDPKHQSESGTDDTVQGLMSNEGEQMGVRGSVVLELVEDPSVDTVKRCKTFGEYLKTITGYPTKRPWQAPPLRGAKPIVPHSSPISGLVETINGEIAVTKLVPKEDLCAPVFFGDRRTGYTSWLTGFNCPDSYSISFDLLGGCRVCCSEHQVFPSNLMGTLVVGDAYTPNDIGGKGKCVPVFRQHNAGFQEIKDSLRFLLRYRKTQGVSSVGRPNLIIISLPAYLKAVGPDHYLKEFETFRGWLKHYLQTGCDYELWDPRTLKPCDTKVEVCEGFSLFKRGDCGLAESFSVIARSLKILTAVDPSNNSGFFYEVMKNVMTKHCQDSPPQTEMVRYCPIYPVKPEFLVYDHMMVYKGLPEACFVCRNVEPEVGVYFKKELISRISVYYSKGLMGDYLKFLPLLEDIESASPCDPAGQLISPEKTSNANDLSIGKTRVLVIGDSILSTLSTELEKTIEDTVVYEKYPFDVLAKISEIESFIAGLSLGKSDIVVLGGQGNSLLQGMLTPKFKKHEPSGKPAGFYTSGAGSTKVFHALNVASYDPEYLDKFGVFAENIVGCVKQTGAKVIFIPPFPRYPTVCCTQSGHFCAGYDGNLFNAEVVRLGTYISRLHSLSDAFVLTPEDYSHRDDWVSRGMMLKPDFVHLTDRGIKAVVIATQKCVHLFKVDPPTLKLSLGDPIPAGTSFSVWVESYRELCGFESLNPHSFRKRSASGQGQQRPSKYRR